MRIGIDCDGVLRDFIPDLVDSINETHPEYSDKILVPESWDWDQWLPFWKMKKLKNMFLKITI